jgi:hypothetical protein
LTGRGTAPKAGHARRHRCIDSIKTDGDSIQTRRTKRRRPFGRQQQAIAGESNLAQPGQRITMRLPSFVNLLQQRQQTVTQQGFSASESKGVNPETTGNPNQTHLLLQTEQAWGILRIGAAVRAGQIAAGC